MRTMQATTNPTAWRGFLAAAIWQMTLTAATLAEGPADRFVRHIESTPSVPAEARELIRKSWADCDGCDGEEFLTQGLAVFSEPFRKGLDAFEEEDYGECARIMGGLLADSDPFVAANARAYEIRAMMQLERLVDVGQRVDAIAGEAREAIDRFTYFAAELDFIRAFALLADVRYEEAAAALQAFLRDHADAPQRLVIPARQMLLELNNREPEKIGDVVDLMSFCSRQLKHADSGDAVRQRQDRIIELLDKLVEEAEQQEQSGGGSSGSGNSGGSRAPSNPMQQSTLPGGSAPEGGGMRESRRANPGEAWGAMPPAERERILQALRDSFPSRYRRLVEQYYEDLAKRP